MTEPYYQDKHGLRLWHDDVLRWAANYRGPKFHTLLTDPPYELGFMNAAWDKSGIAFQKDTWAAFYEHMHPGAFGMAFGGSRTYHRIACAIEDAGFIMHSSLFGWCTSQGFPKATNVSKQIDKAAGVQGEIVGKHPNPGSTKKRQSMGDGWQESPDIIAPATELAQIWQGHRYGLQAIKPALEPIILFQKPYEGRPIDNMTATGAGALWIDGARIGCTDKTPFPVGTQKTGYSGGMPINTDDSHPLGRWPANLALIHHPGCDDLSCVPECPIMRLGEQSGVNVSRQNTTSDHRANNGASMFLDGRRDPNNSHSDEGTAARYFYDADWMYERIEATDPVIYCPKPSTAEREAGLSKRQRQIVNDGRDTPIDNPYQRGDTERLNTHPTIKPISLSQHLATLLLPPAAYGPRKLLIPFSGAGSECIGAFMAGWEQIEAIELGTDHCAIAQARWQYWSHKKLEVQRDGARHVKKAKNKQPKDQPRLFED